MTTLFAFFHHVLAFTVVSALAIEFILIGQDFTHATAKRLAITDAVLGAAAGLLFVVGLGPRVLFRERRGLLFPQPCLHDQIIGVHRGGFDLDHPDRRVPVMAQIAQSRAVARGRAKKLRFIKKIIHGELAAVVIIVLCAAIMARGGWV